MKAQNYSGERWARAIRQPSPVVDRQFEIEFLDSRVEAFSSAFGRSMRRTYPMDEHKSFSNSIYEEQTYLAERELACFIAAVTQLYGSEQARLSEKDWLEELELMDSLPLSTNRQWRAVTIAASARLAGRLSILPHHTREPVASS
jgi:hypothetical protein